MKTGQPLYTKLCVGFLISALISAEKTVQESTHCCLKTYFSISLSAVHIARSQILQGRSCFVGVNEMYTVT
jgi:hypothetical protein